MRRPDIEIGAGLPVHTFRVTRADLVRYAGASGDFNPIHWSDRFAQSVGLPGVIAHGMLTMALAGRALVTWVGDSAAVVEFWVRFANPVLVPDNEIGTEVLVKGSAKRITPDGFIQIDITATCDSVKVLGQARALVAPPKSTGDGTSLG